MEVIRISQAISDKIKKLEYCQKKLKELAENKANKMAHYEKELAKTIIALRNGREFSIDGEIVVNPPVSNIEKIAKGICYQESINADIAETSYKNALTTIEIIKAQLNGYQSIFRHLSEN